MLEVRWDVSRYLNLSGAISAIVASQICLMEPLGSSAVTAVALKRFRWYLTATA